MSGQPQKLFPKGFIAMDSGDLMDVTNVKTSDTNNAKQVHTLRQKGAGISLGVRETTVSFDAVVSETGPERDYIRMLNTGQIKQVRIKVPGETITVNGVVSSLDRELPLDAEIKYSITIVGAADES
jgi:hypothetical protein